MAFRLGPECAHSMSLRMLATFPKLLSWPFSRYSLDERFAVTVGGKCWKFPVGLAAGLDKDAQAINFFTRINFGAVEVGTVTPRPQPGNPPPRLFRLEQERSLLNSMGFNGVGAETVLRNIKKSCRHEKILGVNLGKNKDTPDTKVPEDYRYLYQTFEALADYLVINVSSPNTLGLRQFQDRQKLKDIFCALADIRTKTPLYLKISPDLDLSRLNGILEVAKEFNLEGIIATNTMPWQDSRKGGISGRLLKESAANMRSQVLQRVRETPGLQVIGVGGIEDFSDLLQFWREGGRAVQIYTSFIYQGPSILDRFYRDMERFLRESQADNLEDLLANIHQA